MSPTLTLGLFRPSILDPVEKEEQPRARPVDRGVTRDDSGEGAVAPVTMGGDQHVHVRLSGPDSGPTLDDLVVGVWEDLIAHRTVACLACGEAMTPRYGAGHAPVGGRCRCCGTTMQ
jgi:hypothetical protein